MPFISLPITATVEEIADAICIIQHRVRIQDSMALDPLALARDARRVIEEAEKMLAAVGATKDTSVWAEVWSCHSKSVNAKGKEQQITLIHIEHNVIHVSRGFVLDSVRSGRVRIYHPVPGLEA